jgi:hypothetical protein
MAAGTGNIGASIDANGQSARAKQLRAFSGGISARLRNCFAPTIIAYR